MSAPARLFTIHPAAPFLPTLAEALLDGRLIPGRSYRENPLALADVTLFLPTRRAVRVLGDTFRGLLGGAAVLPRLKAVSDDLDDLDADPLALPGDLDRPPAMTAAERHLTLARLVIRWREFVASDRLLTPSGAPLAVPASTADALRLAADLLKLIDQAALEGIDWNGLATLVPDEYAAWWQLTLTFLDIAARTLPEAIAEQGKSDPVAERRRAMSETVASWAARPPRGPVIVAGSTGSVASTAELMDAVRHLDEGAIVLPGLDLDSDDAVFAAALDDPCHGQHTMAALLARLGLERADAVELAEPAPPARARRAIAARALLPAAFTDRWPTERAALDAAPDATAEALAGLGLVVAGNEAEAALAAALALRETLETPGARAMLVTPDRTAATRVAAELARFGVEAEETAGLPLPQTPAGALALLVAELLIEGYPAAKLVSLFGHPEVRLGLEPARVRVAGRTLEARVLRGPKLAPRLAAVDAMAERLDGDVALIVTRFSAAMAPLEALRGEGRPTLASCLGALEATLALLTEAAEGSLRPVSRAERELLSVLDDYAAAGGDDVAIGLGALPATLRALIGDVVIRTPVRRSRVIITGPLEARLMRADRLVLLGLNEGTWPAAIDTGPWLSRPMRRGLGFAPPEIRIGLSAHDFAEALGTDDVVMIRAARSGGAPTVPTRFLQRLVQLIGPVAEARLLAAGARHLDRARRIDDRPPAERFARPEPKPPLAARPSELTVTEIETLIRDPYAVYAKRVLKLRPLPDLGELPDFGTRGTLVHDTLRDFVKSWTGPWDGSAVAALRAHGGEKFAGELSANPELLALWLPRFEALAEYVVLSFEALRGAVNRHAEIEGAMPVGRDFTLKGRADRIDVLADGRLSIVDFKTGAAPTDAQIAAQLTPQLPLEAVMAARGGFADLGPRTAAELVHVVLRGLPGRDEVRPYRGYDGRNGAVGLDETIEEAGRRLEGLVAAYADPAKGYLSRARPFKRSVVGDYDHLARVKEWMVAEDEGGEE